MINRPTDEEKVTRYVGQIERVHKQLYRLSESMALTLDTIVDPDQDRRLRRLLNRVMNAANGMDTIWDD